MFASNHLVKSGQVESDETGALVICLLPLSRLLLSDQGDKIFVATEYILKSWHYKGVVAMGPP